MLIRIAILLCVSATASFAQNTYIGIVEDVPGVYYGESHKFSVRAVFKKQGQEWQAFPHNCPDQNCLKHVSASYPSEVTWTVTLDGRKLGQIKGRTPKEFPYYSHIGLEEIVGQDAVPIVGKRSQEFAGFLDQPVYRPLVANSSQNFGDPNQWKPFHLQAEHTSTLRQAFRKKFTKLCKMNKDNTGLIPFRYSDQEIRAVKAYASKEGWILARMHLEGAIDCDDVDAGFDIDDPWFLVDSKQSVRLIGQGMWLVDAGDYDNCGKSELVFSVNRHNRGGYILFYDDFKRSATFEFSYH